MLKIKKFYCRAFQLELFASFPKRMTISILTKMTVKVYHQIDRTLIDQRTIFQFRKNFFI